MTYSDAYNLRTTSVKFNDVADAIDGSITRPFGGSASGTSTAYIASPSPAWNAYDNASFITVIPNVTNTVGSPSVTINVSGLGTRAIKRGGADLVAGVLVQSIPTILVYTGTYFEVIATANSLLLDGSSVMLNNLNFGGFKPINLAAGTAGSPAICAGNDIDTGLFSPTGNHIGISTGGTERIRIDNAGKVGIGTSGPTSYLSIVTPSSTDAGISLRGNNVASLNEFLIQQASDGATSYVYNRANGPIIFGTNSLERMRINANGYVGIGIGITANVLIDCARSANDSLTRMRIYNGNSGSSADTRIDVGNDSNQSAVSMFLNSSTNTNHAGANAFHIFNGLNAPIRVRAGTSGGVDLPSGQTSWFPVSDERLKKNIKPLTYGLAQITQVQPVWFDYLDDASNDSKRIGFIAQQLQPIIPEAVWGDDASYFRASSTEIIPVLVKAIQELNAKVVLLEQVQ